MNRVVRLGLDSQFDSGRLGRAQIGIVVMCALVVLIDGFDTQSIALVAPDIATAWGVAPASIGLVFGIGLFGGLLGAVAFGWVSDRFGRKPSVLIAVTLFGIASLLTPLAGSVSALAAGRLLTGFGLGGALPAVIAITSEYTPARMRATVVGVMFCGFPLGAMLGGLASVRLVPAFGWQSVFVVGGVVPLLLLPLLVFRLPESARFLALNGEEERLARVLARVGLDAPPEEEEAESDGGRSRVGRLFSGGRAVGTLSLWATLFLSLLLTYLLASWIPLLARQAGLGPASATLGVVALNLGAIIGCVVIGRIADRTRPAVVVGIAFALGAVAIAAIGRSQHSGAVLLVASLLAGGLSIGAQMCTVGLCAGFYDTSVRATGVGWAVGVGRVGGIVGPVLGGVLIAAGISTPNLFLVAAVASLGAAAAVFGLARRRKAGDEIVALADKTTHREGPATVSSGLDLPTDPGAGGSGSVNRG